tara:strand:+ start:176 stop:406 length:231 start_codon:yes stop_codon:yes gene_type:complete
MGITPDWAYSPFEHLHRQAIAVISTQSFDLHVLIQVAVAIDPTTQDIVTLAPETLSNEKVIALLRRAATELEEKWV